MLRIKLPKYFKRFIILFIVLTTSLTVLSALLQARTFLSISSPSSNEILAGEFLEISLNTQISPLNKPIDTITSGKFQAKLVNSKDQSEKNLNLKIIPASEFGSEEEISFGRTKQYKYGHEYNLKTVAYIPEVESGTYNLSVYFNDISGKTILSTSPIIIQIKVLDTHKTWLSVTPQEGNTSFATFVFESTENSVEIKAIEMGTEDGGTIKDAVNFSLYNHDNNERVADLVDIKILAQTNANYSLYYLRKPIVLSPRQKLKVDLRGVALHTKSPESELNTEERSRIDFTITGVHGQTQDNELIYKMLEIPAFAITDPSKIIKVNITNPSPDKRIKISTNSLNLKWSMFYPSTYLKKDEKPGFYILVCKDPETSCPLYKFEMATTPFSSVEDPLDKDTQFTYNLDLSSLPNGNYTVMISATNARYEGSYLVSGISPYSDKVRIQIER